MSKEKEDLELKSKEMVVRVYGRNPTDVDVLNRWLENGYEIIQIVEFEDDHCVDYVLKFGRFIH